MLNDAMFTREQVLKSDKYRPYYDVLGIMLEENKQYTIYEIEEAVNYFLAQPIEEQVNGGNR